MLHSHAISTTIYASNLQHRAFYMGQCISKSSFIFTCPQRFLSISKFKLNVAYRHRFLQSKNSSTVQKLQVQFLWDLRPQTLCNELVLNKASHIPISVQWCDRNKISITIPKGGHRDTEEGWVPNHNRANILSCTSLFLVAHDGMMWAPEVWAPWYF